MPCELGRTYLDTFQVEFVGLADGGKAEVTILRKLSYRYSWDFTVMFL